MYIYTHTHTYIYIYSNPTRHFLKQYYFESYESSTDCYKQKVEKSILYTHRIIIRLKEQ